MDSGDASTRTETTRPGTASRDHHSIGELLRSLRDQLASLERYEQALARKESGALVSSAARGGALIVVAAVSAFIGAIVFLIGIGLAVSILLAELGVPAQVAPWLGLVLVGAAVLLTAGLCALGAAMAFSRTRSGLPHTSRSIKETLKWIKKRLH